MSRIRIVGGTITKHTVGKHSMYAQENIVFHSDKIVSEKGDEGGVVYKKYITRDLKIELSDEYILESTYAHEQLYSLAEELAEMPFMIMMVEIFGYDIEVSALSKLYRDLSDKKISPPEIIVSKSTIGVREAAVAYSNKRRKIIVSQGIIDEAIKDNEVRAVLMAALVEEYGHHIDNLLRNDLATNGKEDDDIIDEGAKFAYCLFKFDIFKENKLKFASVKSSKFSGDLVLDFSKLQDELSKHVNSNEQYDGIPNADLEYFGAGRNRKHSKTSPFAHGDIEYEALVKRDLFTPLHFRKIYYGNWLRDFSQVIVGISMRSTNYASEMKKKYKVVEESGPLKLSHDGWIDLLQILAIKEFIYDPLKEEGKEPLDDYETLKNKFSAEYGLLTKDILGIYRPEEHIDNPKGLEDESKIKDDKGNLISFNYNGKEKKLYAGDNKISWQIDSKRNMSNFFWIDYLDRPSSVTYMKEQFVLACSKGQTKEGFRHLGAGLHVLEDYFSHTNFIEITLRKFNADVYPWIQNYQGKTYNQLPIVSGTFLTEDTIASVGPKLGDLLFSPELKDYKRRVPKQRTMAEMLIYKVLKDFSVAQKSDTAKKNDNYLGVDYATWLDWFSTYLKFQDSMAQFYIDSEKKEWSFKNATQKIGAKVLETYQKGMNYAVQIMTIFPKIVFNIILNSFDEIVPEAQSHLSPNYGNCPSHSQIAKDSYSHPLNKLAGEVAKIAVEDVGRKFKEGWSGIQLSNYVANTYFVHPEKFQMRKIDMHISDWKNSSSNKGVINRLKSPTIYEHVHHETQEVNEAMVKKIKSIMDYFKKQSK